MSQKQILKVLLVILMPALVAGCSWITDFVIVNTSNDDLFVSYTVSGKICPNDNIDVIPSTKPNSELKKARGKWKKLTSSEYSCDPDTMLIKTSLRPQMALRVARIATYFGPDSYGNEDFDVLRLELRGTEGEVRLKGLRVLKAFKKESTTLYVINY